ncbi:MAG: FkbM family methyltransferase [Proteobacteria bacterium]|nr:FkbM family methyltransferase [Pseudomonadota bacterium]
MYATKNNKDLGYLELSNRCLYYIFQMVRYIPIIKRVYPSLLKRWAMLTWTGGYKVKRYKGFYLLLNCRNSLDRKIGLHGGHEQEQFAYFFFNMKKGCDVFLDIGANIGTYSLQAAQLGVAREIHAFEPDPRNHAQLQANLYLNQVTERIQVHKLALSDKSGMLQFELGIEGKPDLTKVASAGGGPTKAIMAKALDEVVSYQGKKIFLKIDTEGHEFEVLKGAEQLLKNNACFLQVEAWPVNAVIVAKELTDLGYACTHTIHNDHYFSVAEKSV